MRYVDYLNQLIRNRISLLKEVVLFGQNITAGSCLAGVTKNLEIKRGLIINTPNCENSLCGIGFGLMISKVPAVFFMKQQDFLLLGVDHLVNTYNFIRTRATAGSFTIVSTVVDSGYEGVQSSLNNFADFCSMARISGFAVANSIDAKIIINKHLASPGFRIIGISQRLFRKELISVKKVDSAEDGSFFQYTKGEDLTIVCFNFSFPYGWDLYSKLTKRKIRASLFSVNKLTPIEWDKIIDNLKRTKKLVLIDDSKSVNLACDNFLLEALGNCEIEKKIILKRRFSQAWYKPCLDDLKINYSQLIRWITN